MDYTKLKITELKEIAKEKGLRNVSQLKKSELAELLTNVDLKLDNLKEEREKNNIIKSKENIRPKQKNVSAGRILKNENADGISKKIDSSKEKDRFNVKDDTSLRASAKKEISNSEKNKNSVQPVSTERHENRVHSGNNEGRKNTAHTVNTETRKSRVHSRNAERSENRVHSGNAERSENRVHSRNIERSESRVNIENTERHQNKAYNENVEKQKKIEENNRQMGNSAPLKTFRNIKSENNNISVKDFKENDKPDASSHVDSFETRTSFKEGKNVKKDKSDTNLKIIEKSLNESTVEKGDVDGMSQPENVMEKSTLTVYEGQEFKLADADGTYANGILEIMQEGYGFIRSDNYMPGNHDIYISPMQIRRFGLRTGDILKGPVKKKMRESEKFSALLCIETINGKKPSEIYGRQKFENMTPVFPNERIHLDYDNAPVSLRIVDLFSPIGKGQRGMIVSPPKAGKTTLLKQIAKRISKEYQKMHLIVLLIDERPEEVTDIKETIEGQNVEVIYSTFDELPDHHKRVSEMVIEHAKRLVECKEDVVILIDSITRLARAYNLTVQSSGRTLSGGLDPAALHMPKKFFGAARNMREGGSLTILATALIDTGSRMDDMVFEEFKGTGNMELVLNRDLSEKRVFPAIDIEKSGTRRDDLLLDEDEEKILDLIHGRFRDSKTDSVTENIIRMFGLTKNNKEFISLAIKTFQGRL